MARRTGVVGSSRPPGLVRALAGCGLLCLAGCGFPTSAPLRAMDAADHHVTAPAGFEGEACLAMALARSLPPEDARQLTAATVFTAAGVNPALGRPCTPAELGQSAAALGCSRPLRRAAEDWDADAAWESLRAELSTGPAILWLRAPGGDLSPHVLLGHDADGDLVELRDAVQPRPLRVTVPQLLEVWRPHQDIACLVAQPAAADVLQQRVENARRATRRERFHDLHYAAHIRDLKRRLPSEEFHVVLQRPFVVVGDESPEVVQRRARNTVRWAVEHLQREYFAADPEVILDIWLFRDRTSYDGHARDLFGSTPSTPFGYYSRPHRALVMNISTGGGTLVHEIVHPFIESNFPNCPSWFNEGLASLYEQSGERDGRIVGLTNWRLKGLQQAIQDGSVPSFETLCRTTRNEFYEQRGTHYAQARYLCYYLQEQGKLQQFYRDFVRSAEEDPSGLTSLRRVLGRDDLDDWRKEWEQFVQRLRFP